MRRRGFLLMFLLCCFCQLAAAQATSNAELTLSERVFTASKVYSLLQLHFFAAPKASALDLDGSYRNYLQRVLATEDRHQFDLATIEFVAQLHSGHTFFWDAWLDKNNNEPLGFYAMPLDGKWVLQTSFLDNLKPGAIITKVDDTAIEAFFLQQRRYVSASSTAGQRRNLFLLPYLFPKQFTLTLEGGRQVAVDRTNLKKPSEKTEGRWVKAAAIAYIRIPAFFNPAREEEALNYVRQFHRAKVLIVDARNNSGGIPPARLISALMDRPYRGWTESTAACSAPINVAQEATKKNQFAPRNDDSRGVPNALSNSPGSSQSSQASKVITPDRSAFRGRLILLVDGGCVSACEDMIEPSKDSGRATIVGETTQGSSGLPLVHNFGNGMTLRIAVRRYCFPDGSEFEGVGIKPDIEVHTTIDDLKDGRDPVLDKAFELAAKP